MARFYFHIRKGQEFIADLEGKEFPSLTSAWLDALNTAKSVLAGRPPQPELENVEFVIDDGHEYVMTVPFDEARTLFTMH